MATDNNVFQTLVTKGDQPLLEKGKKYEDLKDGQIGIFDVDTNLSVDGSTTAKNLQIALGVRDEDGDLVNVFTGSGYMQTNNLQELTFNEYQEEKQNIVSVEFKGLVAPAVYRIGVETLSTVAFADFGYNRVIDTYEVTLSRDSETLTDAYQKFVDKINRNKNAQYEAYTENSKLYIKAKKVKFKQTGNIDLMYVKIPQIHLNVFSRNTTEVTTGLGSAISEFPVSKTIIEVVQKPVYEQGSGRAVKRKEYEAGGYSGRPGTYRRSTVTGLDAPGFLYFADEKAKYDTIVLEFNNTKRGGWQYYTNELSTFIYIEKGKDMTETLLSVLKKIFSPAKPASIGKTALIDNSTEDGKDTE